MRISKTCKACTNYQLPEDLPVNSGDAQAAVSRSIDDVLFDLIAQKDRDAAIGGEQHMISDRSEFPPDIDRPELLKCFRSAVDLTTPPFTSPHSP